MPSRRSVVAISLALASTLVLGACGSTTAGSLPEGGKIDVVASTNVYGDIAKAIGGDQVEVHSIIDKADADPHDYESNPKDKLAVSRADLGIVNGGGYDDFFGQLSKGVLDDSKVLNVSKLSGMDSAEDFNEHLWYSMPTMTKLADKIAERLGDIAPAKGKEFQANAKKFKDGIQGIVKEQAAIKSEFPGKSVAITEPVPLYFLEDAGLENLTPEKFSEAIENGNDVPAAVMRDTAKLVSDKKIAFLAYNFQSENSQTQELKAAAEKVSIPVVNFTETLPQGSDYLGWMKANSQQISAALKTSQVKGQ